MVITVHCTSCWTAFPVDTNKVPPKGVSARCSVCSHVFRVERPPEGEAETEATPSEAVETPVATPEPEGSETVANEGEASPEGAVGRDDAPLAAGMEAEAGQAFEAVPAPADGSTSFREEEAVLGSAPATEEDFVVEGDFETEPFPDVGIIPEAQPPTEMEDVSEPEVALEGVSYPGMEPVSDAESTPEGGGGTPDEGMLPVMEEVPGLETVLETLGTPQEASDEMAASTEADPSQSDGAAPHPTSEHERPPTSDVGLEAATPDDAWVFERAPEVDPSDVSYEPVGTLEEELAQFGREADLEQRDPGLEVQETFEASVDFWARQETAWDGGTDAPSPDDGVTLSPEKASHSEPTASSPPPVGAFTLGKRDPAERARRLARVLVSDMIMYNPERHQRALAAGTLESDFEEEIAKSWKEYVEQVGRDVAESTDYWRSALNDVLAGGRQVF
jgi:predicted Zn finger-like uncharacterized protein